MVDKRLFCLIFIMLFIFLKLPRISSEGNYIASSISEVVEYKPLSSDPPFFQVGLQVAVFLNLKFYTQKKKIENPINNGENR